MKTSNIRELSKRLRKPSARCDISGMGFRDARSFCQLGVWRLVCWRLPFGESVRKHGGAKGVPRLHGLSHVQERTVPAGPVCWATGLLSPFVPTGSDAVCIPTANRLISEETAGSQRLDLLHNSFVP